MDISRWKKSVRMNLTMIRYIKGTIAEMKKVTWLNGSETSRDTSYVIFSAIFFAGFLGIVDYLVGLGVRLLMNR